MDERRSTKIIRNIGPVSLEKIKKDFDIKRHKGNVVTEEGTIVGINLKKIYVNLHGDVTYGIFVHIRMQNGDQYDYIFDAFSVNASPYRMQSSYIQDHRMGLVSMPVVIAGNTIRYLWSLRHRRKKSEGKSKANHSLYTCRINNIPTILAIMQVCNANEWVEIIGKKVNIGVIKPDPTGKLHPISVQMSKVSPSPDWDDVINAVRPFAIQIHTSDEDVLRWADKYVSNSPMRAFMPEY